MPDLLINRQLVLKTLNKLHINTATGPDGIPNILYKNCAHQLAYPLSKLFKQSINSGIFPDTWKKASVTAIHKTGNKQIPTNYRPISLLPCVSKILEKIVNDHLMRQLENNNLLSSYQFGFRKNRSTCDLLTYLTQTWTDALDEGNEILILTLDFAKAFDKVWHEGLKSKFDNFGIPGKIKRWLTSYLTNRSQFVTIQGYSSPVCPITAGVPQGSVLGPTLFLLHINELPEICKNRLFMFADDSTMFKIITTGDSIDEIHQSIQSDLNNLEEWSLTNRATFNPSKCETFLISRKLTPTALPSFTLNNVQIPSVQKIKLLGLQIDSKLRSEEHTSELQSH